MYERASFHVEARRSVGAQGAATATDRRGGRGAQPKGAEDLERPRRDVRVNADPEVFSLGCGWRGGVPGCTHRDPDSSAPRPRGLLRGLRVDQLQFAPCVHVEFPPGTATAPTARESKPINRPTDADPPSPRAREPGRVA